MADTDRILLAGDVHGSTGHARWLIDQAHGDGINRIAQLGDFGAWEHTENGRKFFDDVDRYAERRDVTVYWLDGNHDKTSLVLGMYSGHVDDEGFLLCRDRVRYAPRGHRWTWADTRFIALGGAYSVDKSWRLEEERATAARLAAKRARYGSTRTHETAGTLWFPEEELTDAELATALADPAPVDVMLTHDKPRASAPRWNRKDLPECWPNQDRIQAAVRALVPRLLVHGHLHYRYRDQIRATANAWTTVIGLAADPAAGAYPDYRRQHSCLALKLGDLSEIAARAVVGR